MIPKIKFLNVTKPHFQSPKIQFNPPKQRRQGIQLQKQFQNILQSSFVLLILGKPGSGKSSLITELISREQLFKEKFDRILYIGPTKYYNFIQDDGNWNTMLDIKWIKSKCKQIQTWCHNLLLVFDDVVSQLPSSYRNQIQELFYVRRHLLPLGTINIIFTTQKYTSVPSWLRVCCTSFISFGCGPSQIKKMKEQFNITHDRQILLKYFGSITKHGFLYFNLESGKTYNDKFIQI